MGSSDSSPDSPSGEVSPDTGPLEVDRHWEEAREAAGLDPGKIGFVEPEAGPGPLLSPYLILYAGFFLGPAFAFASSLLVAPRGLTIRRTSVMLGICGAAWCALQGATLVLAPAWSDLGLQVLRSVVNFSASALLVLFWRRESPSRFVHDRRAVVQSVAAGVVLLALFSVVPTEFLAYLGR